ncbi:SIS domain-containing protein [Salipaludibacillus sp. CUR1]|uniref:SIS domain-containing protein n=1 Tax=Salipaludibacillus sp. CUR1 TaxID=2820003 RepID=UPI001E63D86D|nr:SIS domain-containing protein [Salipaludibacillus sp. CUR1]MCE7794098.1 SIS domain-containing protein [Salipaludibacillus sp. CUR1]
MIDEYFSKVQELLDQIKNEQRHLLKEVAVKAADSIENNGIIQLFGAGHSHIFGEEVFYRAGGLVPVKPILEENIMLHRGAVRSSMFERSNDYAAEFVKELEIGKQDLVIVSSTSGRNAVPVETAIYAKKHGACVAALTSITYSSSQESRHQSGKRLYEVADITIDNLSVKGDAVLSHPGVDVPFAPTSTVTGACIINSIIAETIGILGERGVKAPVFLSGNLDGADEHNAKLIKQYKDRIPML